MKILQAVGWYFPTSLGGTEVYVAALAEHFRREGHEVTVAVPDPGAEAPHDELWQGVPVWRYPTPAQPDRGEVQSRRPVRGGETFHRWLAAQQFDVTHFHTFVPGLGLHEVRAARAAGAKVVATTHAASLGYLCQRGTLMRWGTEPCDGLCRPAKCAACALVQRGVGSGSARLLAALPPGLGHLGERLVPGRAGTALGMSALIAHNQRLQRELLATVDGFVVLTEWARKALALNGLPAEKVVVNRLGHARAEVVPKPGPETQPTQRPVRVGYLGRFDPVKGVHDLARAVVSLSREVPVRVELRGPVQTPAEQRVLAELREIAHGEPRIAFADPVAPGQALEVLAGYDLLCCPSVCVEGGPTVALEAFAVGTPVIGSRLGGLAEIIEDGVSGRLFPPGDWRELARLLAAIAHSPASTVDRWRVCLPPPRTMAEVAADYLELYTRLRP